MLMLQFIVILLVMARRGRGRGKGAVQYNAIMDMHLMLSGVTPQGVIGNNFVFSGTQSALMARIKGLRPEEMQAIQNAQITIYGAMVMAPDQRVACLIIILGAIFILPLLCLCCSWYRRMTEASYQITDKAFMSLERIFRESPIQNMTLTVLDNSFGKSKFDFLLRGVQSSKLKSITLINLALPFDLYGDEYDDFKQNGQPLKQYCKQNNIGFQGNWQTTAII